MSHDENSSMLSERAEAFSVAALLGIRNSTPTDYSQESSSENILQVEDKNKTENKIEMELISTELWSQFHKLQNEMIITKSGRRIFPTLKVLAKGLDPNSDYIIWIDIVPVDQLRYRYVYHSSQWIVAGSGEKHNSNSTYIHPDSPSSGKYWMSQLIIFDKVKLTNSKELKSKEQISLLSMHKYQPRFHIQKVVDSSKNSFPKISSSKSLTFTFPETQFLTVTAYQNQQITHLKIACNPFAKGFREVTRNSQRKLGEDLLLYQNSIEAFKSENKTNYKLGYKDNYILSNNINIMEKERPIYLSPLFIYSTDFKEKEQKIYNFQSNANSHLFPRYTFGAPILSYTNLSGFSQESKMEPYLKSLYESLCEKSNSSMESLSGWGGSVDNRPLAFNMPSTIEYLPSPLEHEMMQVRYPRIQSKDVTFTYKCTGSSLYVS